jgi:type IV pilus assembly protein PilB
MGVEPYNLASSLSLIIAQRLARQLCPHCKQPHQLPSTVLEKHLIPEDCADCNAGYSGRIGIYEVMPFDADMQQALSHKESIVEIEALQLKMKTLSQSGIEILKQGITSYQELQRVLHL